MKKFKSLASTHIRKIAILLVICTLSSTILCSCGDDKNSTQSSTTQSTTQSTKPTTEQGHVHTWTTETYYTTETQTIEHDGCACSGCGAWRNLSSFFSKKRHTIKLLILISCNRNYIRPVRDRIYLINIVRINKSGFLNRYTLNNINIIEVRNYNRMIM